MSKRTTNIISKSKKKASAPIKTVQYVIPLGNGWVVKSSRAKKFMVITDTKREAVTIARTIAKTQHTELIVHAKDGSIQLKESYIL